MEKVAKDNGINLVQNRNRLYSGGADEDIYITASKIPFSHLQALKGNIMATLDVDDLTTLGAMMDHRLVRAISYLTTGRGNAYINGTSDLPPVPGFPAGKDAWSFFDDPGTITLNELSAQGKTIVLTETAQNAAITALANKAGLTPEQLTQIVNDAVKNAVVDVNVTVHDDVISPTPTPPVV